MEKVNLAEKFALFDDSTNRDCDPWPDLVLVGEATVSSGIFAD